MPDVGLRRQREGRMWGADEGCVHIHRAPASTSRQAQNMHARAASSCEGHAEGPLRSCMHSENQAGVFRAHQGLGQPGPYEQTA